MNPNPPSWISARITTWPKGLQWSAVSTTTRPVTHTADVAVNSASSGWVQSPLAEEIGRTRMTVPIVIRTRKPRASTPAGRRGGRRTARRTSTTNERGTIRSGATRGSALLSGSTARV